ncbi:MAG: hypothetical protein M4579_003000 [Chaenotheca gracillima]|nr:MAG: hypothetical protein M4579_003000 [Chaenotheca gracillima]
MQQQQQSQQQRPNRVLKRRGACSQCRLKKVRCDGVTPNCSACAKHGVNCSLSNSSKSPKGPLGPNLASTMTKPLPSEPPKAITPLTKPFTPLGIEFDTLFNFTPIPFDADLLQESYFPPFEDTLDFDSMECDPPVKTTALPQLVRKETKLLDSLFPPARRESSPTSNNSGDSGSDDSGMSYTGGSSALAILSRASNSPTSGSPQSAKLTSLFRTITAKLENASRAVEESWQSPMPGPPPNYQRAMVHKYVNAYFDECHSQFPFLIRSQFDIWLGQFLANQCESAVVPLVNAVLAIGCRLIGKEDVAREWPEQRALQHEEEATRYFSCAMRSRPTLLDSKPTVTKVQALIAMSIFCEGLRSSKLCLSLISSAIQQSLALEINRTKGVVALARNAEEEALLQRIFWVQYSIEKPLTMRLDRSSSLDDRFIDYPPPGQDANTSREEAIYMLSSCRYGKLCSILVKKLYGVNTQKRDNVDTIRYLHSLADEWLETVQDMPKNSCARIESLFRYHEAILAIYQKGETAVQSAREILSAVHMLHFNQSGSEWALIHMPMAACCVLLSHLATSSTPRDSHSNLPFLGMASGWMGRLAVSRSHDLAFEELMEAISIAQQLCTAASLSLPPTPPPSFPLMSLPVFPPPSQHQQVQIAR